MGQPGTKLAQHAPLTGSTGTKLALHGAFLGQPGTKLAQHAIKRRFSAIFRALGEFSHAQADNKPSRANFFTHRTQPRGNCETAITTATADADQHETTITTATEKQTQNTHFSPAKAMVVSSEARLARAKATPVSRERFVMPTGYGGAWPGTESTHRATHQRPGATGVEGAGGRKRARLRRPWAAGPGRGAGGWRQGQGGPQDDAPSHTPATQRRRRGGRRRDRRARLRHPWAAAGPGRGTRGRRQGLAAAPVGGGAWPRCRWVAAGPGRASRSTTPSRRLACGDLAGGPPPTGTHSGRAHKAARDRCAA